MITDVCNRAGTKLQRPTFAVSNKARKQADIQHFSEIQLSHGRDPSPSDLKTLTESHEVILTIFRHAPNLLLNVVPLLEENLRAADETPLRQLTTQTLGTMFGERPVVKAGVVDLARAYPATWRAWLGRRLDKAVSVRVVWIEAARDILVSHPELRKELEREWMGRRTPANSQLASWSASKTLTSGYARRFVRWSVPSTMRPHCITLVKSSCALSVSV